MYCRDADKDWLRIETGARNDCNCDPLQPHKRPDGRSRELNVFDNAVGRLPLPAQRVRANGQRKLHDSPEFFRDVRPDPGQHPEREYRSRNGNDPEPGPSGSPWSTITIRVERNEATAENRSAYERS